MADDSELSDRIRHLLAAHPAVREVRMFGGLAFMVNGKLAVSAHADGTLLLKMDPRRVTELTAVGQAVQAEMSGRKMARGWVTVAAEHLGNEQELAHWVGLALAYNDDVTGG